MLLDPNDPHNAALLELLRAREAAGGNKAAGIRGVAAAAAAAGLFR